MTLIHIKIGDIIGCHPMHHELFIVKNIDELSGLKSSMMKDGKWNPIHVMYKEDGDRPGYYMVDGVSTFTVAEALKIEELPAIVHPWSDDPTDMMVDLNTNEHRTSKGLYLMAEVYWKKYSPGQGSRTDLTGQVKEEDTYDKIARKLKLKSGHIVKQHLRIGRTNESFFISMDKGETSLSKAYFDCVAIEKQKSKSQEQEGEYVSSTTEEPEFTDPASTDAADPAIEFEYKDGVSKEVKSILKKFEKLSDENIKMFFHVLSVNADICVCCGSKMDGENTEEEAS